MPCPHNHCQSCVLALSAFCKALGMSSDEHTSLPGLHGHTFHSPQRVCLLSLTWPKAGLIACWIHPGRLTTAPRLKPSALFLAVPVDSPAPQSLGHNEANNLPSMSQNTRALGCAQVDNAGPLWKQVKPFCVGHHTWPQPVLAAPSSQCTTTEELLSPSEMKALVVTSSTDSCISTRTL